MDSACPMSNPFQSLCLNKLSQQKKMKISRAQIPGLILRIQPPGKFAILNTLRARHVAIFWLLLVRAIIVFSPGIIL